MSYSKSRLKDHKVTKNKVVPPFNQIPGLTLHSWSRSRMPQYLWLGLILQEFKRELGLAKIEKMFSKMGSIQASLHKPSLPAIMRQGEAIQGRIFEVILQEIGANYLFPLTAIYQQEQHRCFFNFFYDHRYTVKARISLLEAAIKKYYAHQSNEATDLRYLVVSFMKTQGMLCCTADTSGVIESLKEYAVTPHNDEKMRLHRPTVRSLEGGLIAAESEPTNDTSFWHELSKLSGCQVHAIRHNESEINMKETLTHLEEYLNGVYSCNKENFIVSEKIQVLCGLVANSMNVLREIVEGNLNSKILGRIGVRIIAENFMISKYLLKNEPLHSTIWKDYKIYGIGKLKLVLLKLREKKSSETTHVSEDILEVLSNEEMGEEFISSDLGYFDKLSIRDKFIDVDEKPLFDVSYDYDSGFAHGLWGAVRESSMTFCNNPAHQYHAIPEFRYTQSLPDVFPDGVHILERHLTLIEKEIGAPAYISMIKA